MASKGKKTISGTDGSDFAFRQTVVHKYNAAHSAKAGMSINATCSLLLGVATLLWSFFRVNWNAPLSGV